MCAINFCRESKISSLCRDDASKIGINNDKLYQIIKLIVNLRLDMKDLTVEVNSLKKAMTNFRPDMEKNDDVFKLSLENFKLAMEVMFLRFLFAITITMILTGVSMVFLWWGLNKLFG